VYATLAALTKGITLSCCACVYMPESTCVRVRARAMHACKHALTRTRARTHTHLALLGDEEIGAFDVAMQDLLFVQVVQSV